MCAFHARHAKIYVHSHTFPVFGSALSYCCTTTVVRFSFIYKNRPCFGTVWYSAGIVLVRFCHIFAGIWRFLTVIVAEGVQYSHWTPPYVVVSKSAASFQGGARFKTYAPPRRKNASEKKHTLKKHAMPAAPQTAGTFVSQICRNWRACLNQMPNEKTEGWPNSTGESYTYEN